MIKIDEDALICDLAETYQIYDYRQLPATAVAVFSVGLREDSRIKMKLSGQLLSTDTMLMIGLNDKLNLLLWAKSADGQKNRNRPTSILDTLNNHQKSDEKPVSFYSGKDFENTRNRLLEEMSAGGDVIGN